MRPQEYVIFFFFNFVLIFIRKINVIFFVNKKKKIYLWVVKEIAKRNLEGRDVKGYERYRRDVKGLKRKM